MRCKCGFNSFDHHLVCPKCRRDLTAARRLLNLDVPAPGTVNFFQIAGQRMAVPRPFLGAAEAEAMTPAPPLAFDAPADFVKPVPPHRAAMDQIKSVLTETGDLHPEAEPHFPGGRDGTPSGPASSQAGAPDEDDDLSSLVGGLNLDDLEGDL
jgi:hypothetical protein